MAKKERSEETAELMRLRVELERLRNERSATFWANTATILQNAFKYGAWALAAWQVRLAVAAVAGHETSFRAFIDAAFKFDASKYGALAIAALVGFDNYRQRKLRKKEVAELSRSLKEYETLIDPDRTSSGLTNEGTPPQRVLAGGENQS